MVKDIIINPHFFKTRDPIPQSKHRGNLLLFLQGCFNKCASSNLRKKVHNAVEHIKISTLHVYYGTFVR